MTEEQARKRWCPFAREFAGDGVMAASAINRPLGMATYCECIASDCMAWQWAVARAAEQSDDDGFSTTNGYCGLARRP